jgi:hypothetical protein
MTEYELFDAYYSVQAVFGAGATFYLTVLSGYLIVAYMAGKDLSVFQLMVISVGFVCIEFGVINVQARRVGEIQRLQAALADINPDYGTPVPDAVAFVMLCVAIAGVLSALAFMWNSRRGNAS